MLTEVVRMVEEETCMQTTLPMKLDIELQTSGTKLTIPQSQTIAQMHFTVRRRVIHFKRQARTAHIDQNVSNYNAKVVSFNSQTSVSVGVAGFNLPSPSS